MYSFVEIQSRATLVQDVLSKHIAESSTQQRIIRSLRKYDYTVHKGKCCVVRNLQLRVYAVSFRVIAHFGIGA